MSLFLSHAKARSLGLCGGRSLPRPPPWVHGFLLTWDFSESFASHFIEGFTLAPAPLPRRMINSQLGRHSEPSWLLADLVANKT